MITKWVFPFGQPVRPVVQEDRGPKDVFVLGVYASAVHAHWVGLNGRTVVRALGVASEPYIFWRGENAAEIISRIAVPDAAGRLVPADSRLNGPSGQALDDQFLTPLNLTREKAWLCDLVPHSCKNTGQAAAIRDHYDPIENKLHLPSVTWPELPSQLASEERRLAIEAELMESGAQVIVTLGDQPLRWFARFYGAKARLSTYGKTAAEYGRLHQIRIGDRDLSLLPLVHPRQAGGLSGHTLEWKQIHAEWRDVVAPTLL